MANKEKEKKNKKKTCQNTKINTSFIVIVSSGKKLKVICIRKPAENLVSFGIPTHQQRRG